MDSSKKISVSITPSMTEASSYFKRRFLLVQTHQRNLYLDISDNETLSFSSVAGVLMHRFGISLDEASKVIKLTYINPYSGRQVYRPDHPETRVLNINDKWVLNTYRKSKITPDPSLSAERFIEHLHLSIKDPIAVEFLLDFVAYRFQNPYLDEMTGKPAHALYIFSKAQGQGKSLFTDALTKIFGDSAVKSTTTADALLKQNGYQFWERTWLVVDEVKINDGTRLYDNLKARISKTTDFVDPKNRASIEAELPAQLIMTSNHPPTFIEADDRRFCIIEWDTGLRDEKKEEYFDTYCEWLNSGGYSAIAGLLSTRPTSQYKPMSPPPKTEAKRQAILRSESPDVDRVLEFLTEHQGVVAFEARAFDRLNLSNKLKETILNQAGLKRERPYDDNGKRRGIWLKEGYTVKRGQIIDSKTSEILRPLSEDLETIYAL